MTVDIVYGHCICTLHNVHCIMYIVYAYCSCTGEIIVSLVSNYRLEGAGNR